MNSRNSSSSEIFRVFAASAIAASAIVLAALQAAPSHAQVDSAAVVSAWGPLPEPSDSTRAVYTQPDTPTWATVVDVPYEIIKFPFKIAGEVVEEVVDVSDRIGLSSALGNLFSRRVVPPYTSVGIRAGGEDGFGGSIAIAYPEMPGQGSTVRLKMDAATGGDRGVALGASLGSLERGELQIGGGYRRRPATRFFGLGPESDVDDRSIYLEESAFGGLSFTRQIGAPQLIGHVATFYSGVGARGTERDEDPEIPDNFEDEIPFGYRDRSEGYTFVAELRHDNSRETTRPDTGGLQRARATVFGATNGGDEQFWTWRGEVQQFIPLWFTKRALGVRAFITKIEGQDEVTFQRLMTNDDPDLFRGYADLRFRDRGLAIASAEYRWPIWSLESTPNTGVDAYLFTDVGQVFAEVADVGDNLTTSWGGGFRMGSFNEFVGRVEVGVSEEGTELRFGFEQIFQYDKSPLLRGRIPVPDR